MLIKTDCWAPPAVCFGSGAGPQNLNFNQFPNDTDVAGQGPPLKNVISGSQLMHLYQILLNNFVYNCTNLY